MRAGHAMNDPFQTLGLKPGASEKEIHRAYRKLAARFHPDKNPGDEEAAKRFKEVSDAYAVLTGKGTPKPEPFAKENGTLAMVFIRVFNRIKDVSEPCTFNMCSHMSQEIGAMLKELANQKAEVVLCLKKFAKMRGRFKAKEGVENYLDELVTSQEQNGNEMLAKIDSGVADLKAAQEHLKRYSFDPEVTKETLGNVTMKYTFFNEELFASMMGGKK